MEQCNENSNEAKLTKVALFEHVNECMFLHRCYCLGCNSLNNLYWDQRLFCL